jgi:hypothetical protein
MKRSILAANKNYTFSDFFELAYPTEDIVKEFGYTFSDELLDLPKEALAEDAVAEFRSQIIRNIPRISLNSEVARREFLIAPVLLHLLKYTDIKISSEYPVEVGKNLRGTLDYLIRADNNLTVIEAKKADIDRGFTQLAVELIAIEKYEESSCNILFGAITTGDLWKFGTLDRAKKHITKDINSYRVPADLLELFSILTGILR